MDLTPQHTQVQGVNDSGVARVLGARGQNALMAPPPPPPPLAFGRTYERGGGGGGGGGSPLRLDNKVF